MSNRNNKKLFENFYSRLENENIKKKWKDDTHFREKLFDYIYQDILKIDKPNIVEFGVHAGYSTSLFLDICKLNNGKLYSVDVNDFSQTFNDPNWNFIKSRDDNFDYVEKLIPKKFDVLMIDTLHEARHVEKILYNYYPKLNKDGLVIVDDISWLYYTPKAQRDNFNIEINNRETFFKLIEIFNSNMQNFNLELNFAHSGVCKIIKKNDQALNSPVKIKSREFSIKNFIKNIIKND